MNPNVVNGPTLLSSLTRRLYSKYGQSKPMGGPAVSADRAHFFLLRRMFFQNDLLIIFNTKRCRDKCLFCQLPAKSSRAWIGADHVIAQFAKVVKECRHSLSLLDRVTLSNEGSVLDKMSFPQAALDAVAGAVNELRRVRRLVLETGIEYVDSEYLIALNTLAPRVRIDVLTGFETFDSRIRDEVLGKRESIGEFVKGLDRVTRVPGAALTCYVLFKPDPTMTDEQAKSESLASVEFLKQQAEARGLNLAIRLNPMYGAQGSEWARRAEALGYLPPRLTDVLEVAQKILSMGVPAYIGLSAEGLAPPASTYVTRDDYSRELLKKVIAFNQTVVLPHLTDEKE